MPEYAAFMLLLKINNLKKTSETLETMPEYAEFMLLLIFIYLFILRSIV